MYSPEEKVVRDRLEFAKRRMLDLVEQRGGSGNDLPGAQPSDRDMLLQEFFFHLVGAIEFVAQYLNKTRELGLLEDKVNPGKVLNKLAEDDPQGNLLRSMHCNVRQTDPPEKPEDWDTDLGLVYRIWDYRHQVTHRGRICWHFTMEGRGMYLALNTEDASAGRSGTPIEDDLKKMWDYVNERCDSILSTLIRH